jgi:secreted trypsin-like serine protease
MFMAAFARVRHLNKLPKSLRLKSQNQPLPKVALPDYNGGMKLLTPIVFCFLAISCQTKVAPSDPKIFGGEKVTDSNQFPWMVSFLENGNDHRCGGSLVSPKIVVTAAHCFEPRDGESGEDAEEYIANVRIKIGITRLDDPSAEVRKVKELKFAPSHIGESGDLVLVVLDEPSAQTPIAINENVQIPTTNDALEVIGWGRTGDTFEPDDLYHGRTKLFEDRDECPFNGQDVICTVAADASICSGDSGGPLFAKIEDFVAVIL